MSDKIIVQIDLDKDSLQGAINQTIDKSEGQFRKLSSSVDKSITETFGNIAKKTDKLIESSVAKQSNSLNDILKTTAGVFAGNILTKGFELIGYAIGRVNAFANESIKSFQEQEDAVNRLSQALKSAGSFSEEAMIIFSDYASQLQATTKYGDEVVLSQVAMAKSFGATNEQAKQLVLAAANMAATFGGSLEESVFKLGQTLNGEIGKLGKLVPELKSLTKEQLASGDALEIINKKLSGSAAAEVDTYSGSIIRSKNAFSDLQEEIGGAIVDIFRLKELNNLLAESFQWMTSKLLGLKESYQRNNGTLKESEGSINRLSERFAKLTEEIESQQNRLKTYSEQAKSSFSAAGEVAHAKNNLKELNKEYDSLFKKINSFNTVVDAPVKEIQKVATLTSNELDSLKQKLEGIKLVGISDIEKIRASEEESLSILRQSYDAKLVAADEYNNLYEQITTDAESKISEIINKENQGRINSIKASNQIINQSLGNAISQGIQKVATNLAKGKSIFADFGSWLIGLFGDLAIQLGQFYIADGLAKMALLGANPGAQIAAGASLIALGSILKAFFAGGIGGGGSAGIGKQPAPGESVTPTTDIASPEAIDEERKAPQTSVSIQVNGSLVHQEELGEFITRTLNESFGKQGVTLTDARFA